MTNRHERLRGELELTFVLAVILGVWILQFYTEPATAQSPVSPRLYLPMVIGGPKAPPLKGVGIIHQYQDEHEDLCADIALTGAQQYQNWLPDPPTCPGAQPVCMWWGLSSVGKPVNPDCKVILLWNEPQIAGQSDIDPVVGAEHQPAAEARAEELGLKLTTPCADIPWLNAWANAYYAEHGRWPDFDYVCVHSYPHLIPPRTVQDAVEETQGEVEAAQAWSLAHGGDGDVWLHEFGMWPAWCSPDGECVTEYIEGIVPWLEEQGVPYNWFALSYVGDYMHPSYDTSLVEGGELTEYGEVYAD